MTDQDWAELRTLVVTSRDDDVSDVEWSDANHALAKAVPDLLAEVDRLTEALEAAERDADYLQQKWDTENARAIDAEHEVVRWKQVADVKHRGCADNRARAERAEADLAELRAGVEALANEWECPAHYRAGEHGEAHIPSCHGCTKGGRLRALLSDARGIDSDNSTDSGPEERSTVTTGGE